MAHKDTALDGYKFDIFVNKQDKDAEIVVWVSKPTIRGNEVLTSLTTYIKGNNA